MAKPPYAAADGVKAVEVEYEPLPVVRRDWNIPFRPTILASKGAT
jgi:hypothetical protein